MAENQKDKQGQGNQSSPSKNPGTQEQRTAPQPGQQDTSRRTSVDEEDDETLTTRKGQNPSQGDERTQSTTERNRNEDGGDKSRV